MYLWIGDGVPGTMARVETLNITKISENLRKWARLGLRRSNLLTRPMSVCLFLRPKSHSESTYVDCK